MPRQHASSRRTTGELYPYEQVQGGRGGGGGEYSRSAARYRNHKTRRSLRKKIVIAVVVVLLVALAGGGTAFALWYNNISSNLKNGNDINNVADAANGEPYYVLLLGGDSRSGNPTDDYGNRSDSMMVARVDEANKKVTLVSIPRDLRVNMGKHGYQKINSAIEFGGYDYAIQEVNELLNIQINYYAFIYFDGFEQLVDKLGGVNVDVPAGTYYHGTWVNGGKEGKNVTINGKEALVLARCRHGNPPDKGAYAMGDYQRTLNQRNLIKAIGKKVLASDVTQLPGLISSLSECIQTNMDPTKIVSMAQNMKGMDMDAIDSAQLPIAGAMVNGGWYAVLYKDVFEKMDDNFVNGKELMDGLGNFDTEHNDDSVGTNYVEGDTYCYTTYESLYGSPFSSSSDGSSSASSEVSSDASDSSASSSSDGTSSTS